MEFVDLYFLKKYKEIYYYLFIFFITFYYSLRTSVMQNYPIELFLFFGALCFMLKMISTDYTKKEFLLIVTLLIFGMLNTFFSKSTLTLIVICTIVGVKEMTYKKVLKIILYTKFFTSLMLASLSLFGFIDNVALIHNRLSDEILRYSLGYEHPNVFGKIVFQCILLFLVIYEDKYKKFDWIIFLIFNVFQYYFTRSRTAFLVNLLVIITLLIMRQFKIEKITYMISNWILEFMFLLSYIIPKYIFPLLSTNTMFRKFDALLQYRITYSHIFLFRYDIKLFGQKIINYWSNNYAFLDSGYINLLLSGGLIATILFFIGYIKLIPFLIKNKMKYVIISIVFIAIYSFTENILYSFFYNFTFIYLGMIIFKGGNSTNEEEIGIDYLS